MTSGSFLSSAGHFQRPAFSRWFGADTSAGDNTEFCVRVEEDGVQGEDCDWVGEVVWRDSMLSPSLRPGDLLNNAEKRRLVTLDVGITGD